MSRLESFGLLSVALGLRIGAGIWTGQFAHPFLWEYEQIANHLLSGQGYACPYLGTVTRALCMPGYPLFCAGVYALTDHSRTFLLLLQCLIGSIGCLQIRSIGSVSFEDPAVARIGAWGMALHPGLILYASKLHTLTLDLAVYLAALWAWLRFFQKPSTRSALRAGLLSGLGILFRATLLPFILLATGAFLVNFSGARRGAFAKAGLILLIAGILVAPWLIRNGLLFRRFPVWVSSGGYVLWIGNHRNASGGAHLPDGRTAWEAAPPSMRHQVETMDEMGQDRFFRERVREFFQAHPGEALRLYAKKFRAFWWFSPQTGLLYPPEYRRWYERYYGVIAGLGLLGLWTLRRKLFTPPLGLLVGFSLSIALIQSIYYVDGRHRWTVEPILLLFAAQGMLNIRSWTLPSR